MIISLTDFELLQWARLISRYAIAQRLRIGVEYVDCHLEFDEGKLRPNFMLSGEGLHLVRKSEIDDNLIRGVFAKVWREEVCPALVQARAGLWDVRYGYETPV